MFQELCRKELICIEGGGEGIITRIGKTVGEAVGHTMNFLDEMGEARERLNEASAKSGYSAGITPGRHTYRP